LRRLTLIGGDQSSPWPEAVANVVREQDARVVRKATAQSTGDEPNRRGSEAWHYASSAPTPGSAGARKGIGCWDAAIASSPVVQRDR